VSSRAVTDYVDDYSPNKTVEQKQDRLTLAPGDMDAPRRAGRIIQTNFSVCLLKRRLRAYGRVMFLKTGSADNSKIQHGDCFNLLTPVSKGILLSIYTTGLQHRLYA
jgi:hypothetical protein